ncbi:MAG: hypothetical protein ACLU37_07995 [Collinsella sp.]
MPLNDAPSAVMDRMGYDEVARISAYIDRPCPLGIASAVEAALNVEEPTDLATSERRPSSTRFG